MKESTAEALKNHAIFIAGAPSGERSNKDPVVLSAIADATFFLEKIGPQFDEPKIASGTTSDPTVILNLYWHVRDVNRIVGVYVVFKGNDTCDVSYGGLSSVHEKFPGISVAKALELNLQQRFQQQKTIAGMLETGAPKL